MINKLLLLHLVGLLYYFTYTDDARSNTNQISTTTGAGQSNPLFPPSVAVIDTTTSNTPLSLTEHLPP